MATQWILGKVSDALAPTVQNACTSAGNYAGGAFNAVGSGINRVGESVNTNIRYYGDGAKDYGNSVMDWAGATTSRAQTAGNPLGLSESASGGRAKATSPSVYRAPAAPRRETKVTSTQKRTVASTSKPATSAVRPKPTSKVVDPVKKTLPSKAPNTPVKVPGTAKPAISKNIGASTIKPKAPAKSVVAAASTSGKGKPVTKNVAAKNPLGLSS